MSQIKVNKDGTYTLIGKTHTFENMNIVQMQNIMLVLNYDNDTLFTFSCEAAELGHDTAELGLAGGFMYSYKGS